MDALVDWMYAAGPRKARGMIETALERGVAAVPNAPDELKAFFKTVDNPPAWLDKEGFAQNKARHTRCAAAAFRRRTCIGTTPSS